MASTATFKFGLEISKSHGGVREGGHLREKREGAFSGFFLVRKTKKKRKEKGTREKEKQKKNRENEKGGGEQARVPNLL